MPSTYIPRRRSYSARAIVGLVVLTGMTICGAIAYVEWLSSIHTAVL